MEENCKNCGTELTFVLATISNGQKRVRKQCFKCGLSDSKVYKHSMFKNIYDLPLFNPYLREKFIQDKAEQRYIRNDIGAKHYYHDIYLKSDEWKSKREKILKRDNYECVCCGDSATQVHHINYNHVYQEKEKELLSVCKNCHESIHNNLPVFFKGLNACFGKLGLCQHCEQYHERGNFNLCNSCK